MSDCGGSYDASDAFDASLEDDHDGEIFLPTLEQYDEQVLKALVKKISSNKGYAYLDKDVLHHFAERVLKQYKKSFRHGLLNTRHDPKNHAAWMFPMALRDLRAFYCHDYPGSRQQVDQAADEVTAMMAGLTIKDEESPVMMEWISAGNVPDTVADSWYNTSPVPRILCWITEILDKMDRHTVNLSTKLPQFGIHFRNVFESLYCNFLATDIHTWRSFYPPQDSKDEETAMPFEFTSTSDTPSDPKEIIFRLSDLHDKLEPFLIAYTMENCDCEEVKDGDTVEHREEVNDSVFDLLLDSLHCFGKMVKLVAKFYAQPSFENLTVDQIMDVASPDKEESTASSMCLKSMDYTNFLHVSVPQPWEKQLVLSKNKNGFGGAVVSQILSPSNIEPLDTNETLQVGYKLVAVNGSVVKEKSFEECHSALQSQEREPIQLFFYMGEIDELYGDTSATENWLRVLSSPQQKSIPRGPEGFIDTRGQPNLKCMAQHQKSQFETKNGGPGAPNAPDVDNFNSLRDLLDYYWNRAVNADKRDAVDADKKDTCIQLVKDLKEDPVMRTRCRALVV